MDRRKFLAVAPGIAAGVSLNPSTAEASTSRFRLLSKDIVPVRKTVLSSDGLSLTHRISVHRYVVECPYPVGSYQWLSVVAHKDGQPVWTTTGSEVVPVIKPRRIVFPRVEEEPEGYIKETGDAIEQCIFQVYEAACAHGFDNVKGHETDWKVVWVKFLCTDGKREHIIAALPEAWSSELPLTVLDSHVIR